MPCSSRSLKVTKGCLGILSWPALIDLGQATLADVDDETKARWPAGVAVAMAMRGALKRIERKRLSARLLQTVDTAGGGAVGGGAAGGATSVYIYGKYKYYVR